MQERQDSHERKKPFWFTLFDDLLSIAQLLGRYSPRRLPCYLHRIGIARGLCSALWEGSIVSAVASQVYKSSSPLSAEKMAASDGKAISPMGRLVLRVRTDEGCWRM